jgi:hypothetical protein
MFLIEQEATQPSEIMDIAKIADGIEGIHPAKNSYYVVNKPNGDYVQFAGARDRLVAEVRTYEGEKFTHYIIGYDTEPGLVEKVECNVGPIRVNQNQVLTIVDAKRIVKAFCEDMPWPREYKLSDVTGRFL